MKGNKNGDSLWIVWYTKFLIFFGKEVKDFLGIVFVLYLGCLVLLDFLWNWKILSSFLCYCKFIIIEYYSLIINDDGVCENI